MFKRIILEEWAGIIPLVSFGTLSAVFVLTTLRALRLKPAERERLSNLPLSESSESRRP